MDLPKLKKYVQLFLKKYKPSNQVPFNEHLFKQMSHVLKPMIKQSMMEEPSYWESSGIRIETNDYYKCKKQLTMTKIGNGMFGTVYKVPVKPCMKNIPSDVKVVAVKIENINYSEFYTPTQLKTVIDISHKASQLGIAPKLYDVFILKQSDVFVLVKVYEYIEGTTWGNFKSKTDYKHAFDQLKHHIHVMNEAGIIHHDLHSGNVMISNGKVYIIDFDRANYYATEEENALYMFEQNKYNISHDNIDAKTIFVFNMLLKQKIINMGTRKNKKVF
jgi:predicted Ser/Thr protein kinase